MNDLLNEMKVNVSETIKPKGDRKSVVINSRNTELVKKWFMLFSGSNLETLISNQKLTKVFESIINKQIEVMTQKQTPQKK